MKITKIKISEAKLKNLFPLENFMSFKDLPPLSWDEVLNYNGVEDEDIIDNRFEINGSIKKSYKNIVSSEEVRNFWLKRLSYFSKNPYVLNDDLGEISIIKLKENITGDWILENGIESLALHISNSKKPLFVEGDETEALRIVTIKNVFETEERDIESIENTYQEINLNKIEINHSDFNVEWFNGDFETFIKELKYFNESDKSFKDDVFDNFFQNEIFISLNLQIDLPENKTYEEKKEIRRQINMFMSDAYDHWLKILEKEKKSVEDKTSTYQSLNESYAYGYLFLEYFSKNMLPDIEIKALPHVISKKGLFDIEYSKQKKTENNENGFANYEIVFEENGVSKERIENIWVSILQEQKLIGSFLFGYNGAKVLESVISQKITRDIYSRYSSGIMEKNESKNFAIMNKVIHKLLDDNKLDKETMKNLQNDIRIANEVISQEIMLSLFDKAFLSQPRESMFYMEFLDNFANLNIEQKIVALYNPIVDNKIMKLCCDTEMLFQKPKENKLLESNKNEEYNHDRNDSKSVNLNINTKVIKNYDKYFELMEMMPKLSSSNSTDNHSKLKEYFDYTDNEKSYIKTYFTSLNQKKLTFSLVDAGRNTRGWFLTKDLEELETSPEKQDWMIQKLSKLVELGSSGQFGFDNNKKEEIYRKEVEEKVEQIFKYLNIDNKKKLLSFLLEKEHHKAISYGIISTFNGQDFDEYIGILGLKDIPKPLVKLLLVDFHINGSHLRYDVGGKSKISNYLSKLTNEERVKLNEALIVLSTGKHEKIIASNYEIRDFMLSVFEQNLIDVNTLSAEKKMEVLNLMKTEKIRVSEKLINKLLNDMPEQEKELLGLIEANMGSFDFKEAFVKKVLNLDEFLINRKKYPNIMRRAVDRIVEKNMKKDGFDNNMWLSCIAHAIDKEYHPERILKSINLKNPLYANKILDRLGKLIEEEGSTEASNRSNRNIDTFIIELMDFHKNNAVIVQKIHDTIQTIETHRSNFKFMDKFKSMLPEQIRLAEKTIPLDLVFRDMKVKMMIGENLENVEKKVIGSKKKI